MSQNDQDPNNPTQQSQPSKLPKPSNISQYFDKIDGNPKLWQFQGKLKPNSNDKFTKFTYKTNGNDLGWGFINKSKLKFQTKDQKTKLSVNLKLFNNNNDFRQRNKKNTNAANKQRSQQVHDLQKNSQQNSKQLSVNGNFSKQKKQNKESGDLDVSLSTTYDNNTKLNIRVKDRGQIDIKLNQQCDLMTNSLKARLEYVWQHKNNIDFNKYSLQLLYTTGLGKWINQLIAQKNNEGDLTKITYHKNQTKIKAKISNHSDPQVKITSINHFGQIRNKIQTSDKTFKKIDQSEKQEKEQKEESVMNVSTNQNQILKSKLQLQNKLTLSRKQLDEFNFKTLFNFQWVSFKQSVKLQTTINQKGFNGIQGKYICKYWPKLILGCQFGTNWNSHSSQWHKKWEFILQKQGINYLGNLGLSISNKYFGIRLIKKIKNDYKFQLMASGKLKGKHFDWPKFGIKINMNI